jgi:hypothetical protein
MRTPSHKELAGYLRCLVYDLHVLATSTERMMTVADVAIGHRSPTLCHLGNLARLLGRRLRWDPVQECFPDDAPANEHLDRPRRKPYELPETI